MGNDRAELGEAALNQPVSLSYADQRGDIQQIAGIPPLDRFIHANMERVQCNNRTVGDSKTPHLHLLSSQWRKRKMLRVLNLRLQLTAEMSQRLKSCIKVFVDPSAQSGNWAVIKSEGPRDATRWTAASVQPHRWRKRRRSFCVFIVTTTVDTSMHCVEIHKQINLLNVSM